MKTEDAQKKVGFRSSFRDFVLKDTSVDIANHNAKQISYELIKYYVTEIHNRISSFISPDDFDYSVTDGKDDLGVDLIFRDDGLVTIIQAKYLSAGNGASLQHIQHFQSIFERLRDKKFSKNSILAECASEIDFDKDNFALKFVCLGKIEGQAKQQTEAPVDLPSDISNLADRLTIDFLDETALTEELRNALAQDSGIPDSLELVSAGKRNDRTGILEIDSGGFHSFILIVHGMQIVELYRRAKDSLFSLNIRNYIGNTVTNRGIINTARNKPEHFYHYNNGVSALARQIQVGTDRDRIVTSGLQIINGAQTIKALVKAANNGSLAADLKVLFRVTEVPGGYGAQGALVESITRFNNTQNVIKVSDFRSNDPIQNDLRKKFDYSRRGKRIEYLPKRTDKRRANSIQIRLEDFAKVVYAVLVDPVKFSGSTSFLFDEAGGYAQVFGDGSQVWDTMPTDEFKLRSGIWWLSDEFTRALKTYKEKAEEEFEKAALERKWIVLFAARLILEQVKGKDEWRKIFIQQSGGDWQMGIGQTGMMFDKLFRIAVKAVTYRYKEAMKRPGFVHRNWMRSASTVSDLRDYIRSNPLISLD